MIGGAKGIGIGIDFGLPNIYRKPSGKSYIDPDVLASLRVVTMAYGKTNNDSDRAVVKNLVDASNPFIISNAAYKLNSGYGLYAADFLDWTSPKDAQKTSFEVKITSSNYKENWVAYKSPNTTFKAMKVRISGIPDGGALQFFRTTADGGGIKMVNGINEIPAFTNTVAAGFYIDIPLGFDWSKLVIEQIPSYQGAFVTDGVDDLITSSKTVQDMLGGSNEITVVSMMCQIGDTIESFNRNNWLLTPTSYLESRVEKEKTGKTGIYGYTSTDINNGQISNINSILGDKNDYTANSKIESTGLDYFSVEGFQNEGIWYTSSVAWYWTIIANKVLTTDQINQVIAYYNLDRCVEPTVLYDVKRQGLSNDTPDSDWYLKDYSGNGYDMTLYNYAKIPESGINEGGGLQSDGVEDYGKVTGLPIYKDYTVAIDYQRLDKNLNNLGSSSVLSKSPSVKQGAFLSNHWNNLGTINHCYSFGEDNIVAVDDSERKIYYQSKYSNQGISINAGSGTDGSNMWLGIVRDNDSRFFSGAIYSLMTFPYSMSEFLIERQLKKHKLGTLYPDMVEFRPIVKSNTEWDAIEIHSKSGVLLYKSAGGIDKTGTYLEDNTLVTIYVKPKSADEVTKIVFNGNTYTDLAINNNGFYYIEVPITKSPQKIDITIDEYIRYEDMDFTSSYPFIPIIEGYTWGDKLKVGDKVTYKVWSNMLTDLYSRRGEMKLNGENILSNSSITVEKSMKFEMNKVYLKSNEPKCILSPSRLRIPNSSYKILGYIPDISGHGNHGKINNSAYAGMSGANGYPYDYSSSSFTVNTNLARKLNDEKVEYFAIGISEGFIYNDKTYKGKVKITGVSKAISNNEIYNFRIYSNTSEHIESSEYITITEDGIYDIDIKGTSQDASKVNFFGITKFSDVVKLETPITIEQVGQYEGAYCLDGVDDFVEIPTTVGGKQVLLKCVWNSTCYGNLLYDQRTAGVTGSSAILVVGEESSGEDSKIAYYARNANGKTYIDGILNEYIHCNPLIDKVHNITITNPDDNDRRPVIGASNRISPDFFSSVKFYDFMLFDEIDSDEEILTLNEYVGIEPKVTLPPYYWDAYGKSNTDEDKATIQQRGVAVGDYDLTNNNLVYKGMSGYNGYPVVFGENKTWVNLGEYYVWTVSATKFNITQLCFTKALQFSYIKANGSIIAANNKDIAPFRIKVTGIESDKFSLRYVYLSTADATLESTITINSDGIYELPKSFASDGSLTSSDRWVGFSFIKRNTELANVIDGVNVTIEVLPEYPNGLVLDGVDDHLINENIPAFTDYTYIIRRILLSTTDNSCTMFKGGLKANGGAFISEYRSANGNYDNYSFGNVVRVNVNDDNIVYGTKASYNGQPVTVGTSTDDLGLTLGKWDNYTKMVFYKLMLYPKTLTNLEIMFLKNMFERDEIIDLTNPIFIKE